MISSATENTKIFPQNLYYLLTNVTYMTNNPNYREKDLNKIYKIQTEN